MELHGRSANPHEHVKGGSTGEVRNHDNTSTGAPRARCEYAHTPAQEPPHPPSPTQPRSPPARPTPHTDATSDSMAIPPRPAHRPQKTTLDPLQLCSPPIPLSPNASRALLPYPASRKKTPTPHATAPQTTSTPRHGRRHPRIQDASPPRTSAFPHRPPPLSSCRLSVFIFPSHSCHMLVASLPFFGFHSLSRRSQEHEIAVFTLLDRKSAAAEFAPLGVRNGGCTSSPCPPPDALGLRLRWSLRHLVATSGNGTFRCIIGAGDAQRRCCNGTAVTRRCRTRRQSTAGATVASRPWHGQCRRAAAARPPPCGR